eukprot:scaffold3412_cov171-Ochromonas_danica.AAC.3
MWDTLFFNQFHTSCFLFAATIFFSLRRNNKLQALALSPPPSPRILHRHRSNKLSLATSSSSSPSETVLVELRFPGTKELLRLKNDVVLSKIIVMDTENSPAYAVGAYIADLYSKAWNEAALKKCLDLDCVVLSNSIPGLISSQEVLSRADVKQIYTFRPEYHKSLQQQTPAEDQQKVVEVVDTQTFVTPFDQGLKDNEDRLLFIDSHFQCDLQAFPIYDYVAVGGSFDNLHNGHRKLLMFAAALCRDTLTIGITNDTMLVHKANADFINSYEDRVDSVRKYLVEIKPNLSLRIAQLHEPYGPAITDPHLQALIVSSETILGAFQINSIRHERGFSPMKIVVLNRADAAILSSSFIREQRAQQELQQQAQSPKSNAK